MQVFNLCKQTLVLHLHGCSITEILHRESLHSILIKVQSAAGPDVMDSIHKTLVKECIVRCLGDTDLLGLDGLACLAEYIVRSNREVSVMVHEARRHGHVKAPVRVPEVLPFGNVRRLEVHHGADAPSVCEVIRYASVKGVSLQCLSSRSELQHVHWVEARLYEHRTAHVIAFGLGECK